MTDVDELKVGEELDKLVATRVFGMVPCKAWEWENFGSAGGPALVLNKCEHYDSKTGWRFSRRECWPDVKRSKGMGGWLGGPPTFSDNMTIAWAIVEEMAKRGFACNMSLNYPDHVAWAGFAKPNSTSVPGVVSESMPEAICKAALKIIEMEASHV